MICHDHHGPSSNEHPLIEEIRCGAHCGKWTRHSWPCIVLFRLLFVRKSKTPIKFCSLYQRYRKDEREQVRAPATPPAERSPDVDSNTYYSDQHHKQIGVEICWDTRAVNQKQIFDTGLTLFVGHLSGLINHELSGNRAFSLLLWAPLLPFSFLFNPPIFLLKMLYPPHLSRRGPNVLPNPGPNNVSFIGVITRPSIHIGHPPS